MIKKAVALLAVALMTVGLTGVASAAETNVKERIECMFRVYVTEGGEQGLECLV